MADMEIGNAVATSARFFELPNIPDVLQTAGIKQHLYKGERISAIDGQWSGCYYIQSGLIGTYNIDQSGNEFLTFMLAESCLFLESDMLEGVVFAELEVTVNFVAERDTELLFIRKQDFQNLMRHDTEVARYVSLSIAQKMQALRAQLYESRSHDTLWRVANLLSGFADQCGIQKGSRLEIDFNITQQLIAKMLGTNRITIAKSIKRLKDLGLIEKTDEHYYLRNRESMDAFLATF